MSCIIFSDKRTMSGKKSPKYSLNKVIRDIDDNIDIYMCRSFVVRTKKNKSVNGHISCEVPFERL